MGFSLQDFEDAANKKYKGVDIDDAPGGSVTLRSALRLDKDSSAKVDALNKQLTALQKNEENASNESARELLVELLAVVSTRPAAIHEYLEDKDMAIIMAIYDAYAESTQAASGK